MKLSGHNFDNDVFHSLLDGISKDVELKKTAQTASQQDVGEFFSSTTVNDMDEVHREELEFVAAELNFAAERAKVAIGAVDLAKFASQVQKENLRGKSLERAAQKYCNKLDQVSSYSGTTSVDDLINQLASHRVTPAGYNPEHGANDSATGKFMGSSKNPNTIWDSGKLAEQAQVPLGDEKIKASKQAEEEYRNQMKTAQWQELQDKHSDPEQVHKGITNAGTSTEEPITDQKLPANTMSIFSDNRDFENIPDKTMGESIIADAEARANKKAASNDESRDIQTPKNTRNALDSLFN